MMEETEKKEEKENKVIAFIIFFLMIIVAYRLYQKVKGDRIEIKETNGKKESSLLSERSAIEGFKARPYNLININEDSQEKLEKLPGVGEELGKRIISYRNLKGKFEKKEDIMNVEGIGKKKYEKLKKFIAVR